jgi:iron complex outermembrane receptor protein
MMKRIILSALLFTILSTAVDAQKMIRGKVIDASNNNPLFGATINFSGKGGTTTDNEGVFSVNCETVKKITVSFVGYEPYSLNIKNCNDELKVSLVPIGHTLNDVEITATSNQNKSILYQPASITKLTTVELKRGQGLFLDDAIQTSVPGVIMNRRTVSGGQQFNIRGYGNGTRGTRGISSNFDGQGYKVYLNGIPVTDAEGISTLDDIDYGSIGNVEIVKGPAGTLYGQAIAGAINLKTITPEKGKASIGQDIMLGNYGLQRYTTHFQMGGEHSSILLNYGKQKSDGFSIHNKSDKDFVNFAGAFQPNEKQSITSYFGYTDSYDERLGELTITQYQTKDYSGNVEYIKRNGHSHVVSFRAGLVHTYNFNKNIANTTSIFGTGFRSDVSSAAGWTDKTAVNYGFRTSFDTKFSIADNILLSGITGMELQSQNAQVVGYNMKQNPADTTTTPWVLGKPYWVINATTSNTAFVTTPASFFTEWTLALQHDISITAGVGLGTQKIILDDRFNAATATKPSHFDTTYKNMVSPHIAINKVFSKEVSVYASYSKGYKAPASSYFFITTPVVTTPATPATGRVNNVLKPESGSQFEIGTKGTVLKDRLVYQLAFFSTKYSDKMTSVAVPLNNTTTAYTYVVNGGDQNHKGLEATLKYVIVKGENGLFTNITPFINFTYSDFKYGDNFTYKTGSTTSNIVTYDYSGLNVFGVPKIMNAIGVDAAMKNGLYANLSYLYRDGVNIGYETVGSTLVLRKAGSYNLLNGKMGFRRSLSAHFDLDAFFGTNNITGIQYPIMIFVNQIPDAYLPAPLNAVYYGGLNLKYNF